MSVNPPVPAGCETRHQTPTGSQRQLLKRYIFSVLPQVKRSLRVWKRRANSCPDPELRRQALASLKYKAFHCQGGAVFAAFRYPSNEALLQFIVAYQTLCDYLDNLCDRAGETSGEAFQRLHQSLMDALDPLRLPVDYYQYYPYKNDGGYIAHLVEHCQTCLGLFPSYALVKNNLLSLAGWYSELQVDKHLSWDVRERKLTAWASDQAGAYPELRWNEFAAATGSTLAIFALLNLAAQSDLDQDQVTDTMSAYFPWICGLHILLDYFIDQEEDLEGHDLNFTFYYKNLDEMLTRMKLCVHEARRCAARLPTSIFDLTVVEGLLAMYLSDPKVGRQGLRGAARELISECGGNTRQVLALCRIVRKFL